MRRVLVVLALAAPLAAQLADVQPGRNFPTATPAFGGDYTEDLELGDVDADGDLDVLAANGGNSGNQQNRLFINRGGLQGGAPGTFGEETAARLPAVLDTSRDAEFVDTDADGDLDLYVANRGGALVGQVSRFHANRGGAQGGAIGVFDDATDAFWGTLVSLPPEREEGVQDGQGPWLDWSCDCDFGDLDDDGDLDLFHSSYGPSLLGEEPSRVFLNDGAGRFDELWPWADPAADVAMNTLDFDMADLDGDFDLDLFVSSRETQARVFRNNLYGTPGETTPFTDVTETALILSDATAAGNSNYGAEAADLDGDGDFDVWATSYAGLQNVPLENLGGLVFAKRFDWLRGEPGVDDNDPAILDLDGDGDIDVFSSSLFGTNHVYTGGLAQGLTAVEGLYHVNGTSFGGSLATWPETPAAGNGGSSLDAKAADMDGDGDHDALIGNDLGQVNRYWENALGIPDTHAPTVVQLSAPCDKPEGTATVIHAAVRDNAGVPLVDAYDAVLVLAVDGGPPATLPMTAQGGQQFRGVIPPQAGLVSVHVEVTDDAGNTGVSATVAFLQSGATWEDLGFGLAGTAGVPVLAGSGTWEAGTPIAIALSSARPSATAALFVGLDAAPTPAFGGLFVPVPYLAQLLLATSPAGTLLLGGSTPPGLPCGLAFVVQAAIVDPLAIQGVALSNALAVRAP